MIVRFLTCVFLLKINALVAQMPADAPLPLIPKPAIEKIKAGQFLLDSSVTILANDDGLGFAEQLRQTLQSQVGIYLALDSFSSKKTGGKILIRYSEALGNSGIANLAAEGYFLKISPDTILIDAPLRPGLFYALQTLRQLLGFKKQAAVALPCVDVSDAPSFDYRGVMLDVARHFVPLDFLKKQVDVLAFYKINTLHLHLTDDQGWRIEIQKFPELTRHSAFRTEADGSRSGGFYTQAELRELAAYARARNMEIVPEIEMPGHCSAALSAFPGLSCREKPMPVPANWGVFNDVFCAGKDSTFEFLQTVLEEVMQIFPSHFIHIGGDEVPTFNWKNCPRCQARMQAEGLRDERALQAYFVRRIQRFLESRGRELLGWDEILDGGADSTAVVEVWQNMGRARPALANGNRMVLAPNSHYYLNRPPGELPLDSVFLFDPLGDSALLVNSGRILGIEAPLWSENITPLNFENMLYPRLLAVANTAWTGGGNRDLEGFRKRVSQHFPMLDSLQIGYGAEGKTLAKYSLKFSPKTRNWTLFAERGLPDIQFRYLTQYPEFQDFGVSLEQPGFTRQFAFSEKLTLAKPLRFKVAPFRGERQMAEAKFFDLVENAALGKAVQFNPKYDERYPAAGDFGLTDGRLGSLDFNDGAWLGWQGNDLVANLELDSTRHFQRVSVRFLQQSKSWILLPTHVSFYTSDDGVNWSLAWINELKINALDDRTFIEKSIWEVPANTRFQFLQVVARNYGELPAGHNGAGGQSWIFADEILVEP